MKYARIMEIAIPSVLLLATLALTGGCSDDGTPPSPPPRKECNHLLDGPWMLIPDNYPTPEEWAFFVVFDGHGIIADCGGVNMSAPAGSYVVYCGNDTTGTMILDAGSNDPSMEFSIAITSPTTARINWDNSYAQMDKISDSSRLAGLWDGYMQVTAFEDTIRISFEVNLAGFISNVSGLQGFERGKAFADDSNRTSATFHSARSDYWHSVFLHIGTFETSGVWTGQLESDSQDGYGTYSFTRR